MLKNPLTSPGPLVIPLEALSAANGLLPHQANRFSMPFVSIEKSQKPETNRTVGNTNQPMFVPVIVGAVGQNHVAGEVAQLIVQAIAKRNGVETKVVGLGNLASVKLVQADAMILIVPEYNYGYPDVLKTVLEKNLPERARTVVGICDLSPGWFGGSRLLETLLPVMRKSGLIPIFWDENRSTGEEFFEAACGERIDSFLKELLLMAAMLRQHREALLPN
ncbi:NAD(P)H-dependent oxidoreductase [candidate division KSB1 bacterium]|nr:NAD(P)H-dependent oxidoreductase [candidate division KSB1 bacterium]